MAAAIAARASRADVGGVAGGAIVDKLAQLQNLVKREPDTYIDEFRLQQRAFAAELAIFQLNPRSNSETFKALVMFLAHVASSYKKDMEAFPAQLMGLLSERAESLTGDVRRTLVTALILLRNRGMLDALPLFRALFPLFRVKDKALRDLVTQHVIADVRAMNMKGHRDDGANKGLQNLMFTLVADEHAGTAKRVLDILIELHRRRVWTDARTVNVIGQALVSDRAKLLVTALKFFLGPGSGDASANAAGDGDGSDGGGSDDESDDEDEKGGLSGVNSKDLKNARHMHAHAKSTRKRERQISRRVNALKKAKLKENNSGPTFPAIQLLHDPQGTAERIFSSLRSGRQRFEVRLLQMNLVSRLIGTHRLLLLPFYSYCQKYLAAHQAHVTQVLVCLIQACHDLVPPDEVMPVVTAIANAFISDRSSPEVIQVGLNALRNVVTHTPTVLEEPGMTDLLPDLLAYRKFRHKGVVSAARALLNTVRELFPSLLKRRDRGRDAATDADAAAARPSSYGATSVATGVEGADLLSLLEAKRAERKAKAAAASGGVAPAPSAKKSGKGKGKKGAVESDGSESDDSDAIAELLDDLAGEPDARGRKGRKGKRGGARGGAAQEEEGDDDEDGDEWEECSADSDEEGGEGGWMDVDKPEPEEAPQLVGAESDSDEEGEEDGSDDEDMSGDEEEDEEGSDDEGEEEEQEAVAPRAGASRKRRRPADSEEEEEDSDDESEGEGGHAVRRGGPRSVGASSSGSALALPPGPAVEGARMLAPRDFARIRKLRRALGERGVSMAALTAALAGGAGSDGASLLSGMTGGSGAGAALKALLRGDAANDDNDGAPPKKRYRGARRGTREAAAAEAEAEAEAEEEAGGLARLSRPGAVFSAPVAVMDEEGLEAVETKKKRRAARRVADVLTERSAKFEGKRIGGGLTNAEKSRFKAFQMLRKSAAVQAKAKRSLVHSQRMVRSRLKGQAVMDKRKKQRRRRA